VVTVVSGLLRPAVVAAAALGAALPSVLAAIAVHEFAGASAPPDDDGWTASWTAPLTPAGGEGMAARGVVDATLRQVVHLSLGGSAVRLRLSHEYGDTPLTVGEARVGAGAESLLVDFGGVGGVTIPAGGAVVSDPVPLAVANDSDLTVDLYLRGPTGVLSQHARGGETGWIGAGRDPNGFRPYGVSRLVLTGVDVASEAAAIVLFGDSITDGLGSTVGADRRYPDVVADRLRLDGRRVGVVNAGLSGNRLLADRVIAGESALARFERDVVRQPGARTVVVLEGINDIHNRRGLLRPQSLIAAYERLVDRAHAAGIRVVGGTITPYQGWSTYNSAGEQVRRSVNAWIRSSGTFDAVVDFDAAVRDPLRPSRLRPDFDSGDGLHLNDTGYAAMAAALDMATLA
jgi:lysophospholipase L1-like esterase